MFLAAFEPGKEMAIANFFLAIFFLFTITLPFILITRGDKTEANRDFIAATINPWSQIDKKIELTPVVVSGITPIIDVNLETELISENNDKSVSESERIISLEIKRSDEQTELPAQIYEKNDEVLVA